MRMDVCGRGVSRLQAVSKRSAAAGPGRLAHGVTMNRSHCSCTRSRIEGVGQAFVTQEPGATASCYT